ncbi:MAG: DUF2326 domain-containing protein [Rickettsiales bacterium]|jgi:uncharacterized protein YydD (DUF2326 family)|nr:DUF2326 domain-containing protein [Rickettsiales bacterium]
MRKVTLQVPLKAVLMLCIAFDLAVLRVHLDVRYPRFVFHDGVLEALDDRKKMKLLEVLRRYAGYGLQPIITVIESNVNNLSLLG